jgi:hypothetical protein
MLSSIHGESRIENSEEPSMNGSEGLLAGPLEFISYYATLFVNVLWGIVRASNSERRAWPNKVISKYQKTALNGG